MQRRISSIPGRLRVRDTAWRHSSQLTERAAHIRQQPGIKSVEENLNTGSVLVLFDPLQTRQSELDHLLGLKLAATPKAPRTSVPAAPKSVASAAPSLPRAARRKRPLRMEVNRVAKMGMIGSLGVSLGLAAAGATKGHALAGGAFLAALATHLTVHRRHILR